MIAFVSPRGTNIFAHTPWSSLPTRIAELTGQEVTVISDGQGDVPPTISQLVVASNVTRGLGIARKFKIPTRARFLVVLEPSATAPGLHSAKVVRQFGRVFVPSPMWKHQDNQEIFNWPQNTSPNPLEPHSTFGATLIAANKFSAAPDSQYALRRQIIGAFDKRGIPLAVVGPGWTDSLPVRVKKLGKAALSQSRWTVRANPSRLLDGALCSPKFPLGFMSDKREALSLAPVSIVVENSPDYVSEKVIDCIRCGIVPLYVGPSLSAFGIPSEVGLEVRPDAQAVVSAFTELDSREVQERRRMGLEWISSGRAKHLDGVVVLDDLASRISKMIQAAW